MKIVCAWCGGVIRDPDGTLHLASHGVCQRCAAHEMAKSKLTKPEPGGDQAKQAVNPKK